jgi:hypothetical protein
MYSHKKIPCLTVVLFQENKSFGASYHLHSSSDVREAVLRTLSPFVPKKCKNCNLSFNLPRVDVVLSCFDSSLRK